VEKCPGLLLLLYSLRMRASMRTGRLFVPRALGLMNPTVVELRAGSQGVHCSVCEPPSLPNGRA
jgi:hypothetical protein